MKNKKLEKNVAKVMASAKHIKSGYADKYTKKNIQIQDEIDILRQVSESTKKKFNLKTILSKFLSRVMQTIGSKEGAIILTEMKTKMLYFAAVKGHNAKKYKEMRVGVGNGICGWVAVSGKATLAHGPQPNEKWERKKGGGKILNVLCAPLIIDKETVGVLELWNKENGKAFNSFDLKRISFFATFIAMIIKNEELLLEKEERVHLLENIMEISQKINSTINLNSLLDKIIEISTTQLKAEAGSILLLEEGGNELVFQTVTGSKKGELKEIRIPVGEGIAGWVIREDKILIVEDAQRDPRFYKKMDQKLDFVTHSVIAVPLKSKGKMIGVMEVINKKNKEFFNQQDEELLVSLSNQAAVAMENAKLFHNLQKLFINTIDAIVNTLDAKDPYTRGHSRRVTEYSELIGIKMGYGIEKMEALRIAAILHDVGKMGVPESILIKPDKLTDAEYEIIKEHPSNGVKILEKIPQLKETLLVILSHHENYDGTGYPNGIIGEAIPEFARIISIADTFDAMTSDRPYRKGLPIKFSIREIGKLAGKKFDPEIVKKAVSVFRKISKIKGD
ncbi:MAG: HD domain-containing phosphohydrolase [bacterium]